MFGRNLSTQRVRNALGAKEKVRPAPHKTFLGNEILFSRKDFSETEIYQTPFALKTTAQINSSGLTVFLTNWLFRSVLNHVDFSRKLLERKDVAVPAVGHQRLVV